MDVCIEFIDDPVPHWHIDAAGVIYGDGVVIVEMRCEDGRRFVYPLSRVRRVIEGDKP